MAIEVANKPKALCFRSYLLSRMLTHAHRGRILTYGEMVTIQVANKTKALCFRSYVLAGNFQKRSQKPVEDYGVGP